MKFEQPQSHEQKRDNKRDIRLESIQVPYQREELLDMLSKRMRYVTGELQQVEELPPSREKAARLRQLSNWYQALADASTKFSRVTKEELADPALEGQVWVSGDFQSRLNEIAREEDEGREAVARLKSRISRESEERQSRENIRFMEMQEQEREMEEENIRQKLARTPIGDRDVEMELEDQDIDEELTAEQVALAKEPTQIKRRGRSRAENDAYVASLGKKLEMDEPFADLAAEKTVVEPVMDVEDTELREEKSGERLTENGREREHRLALMRGLEELEDISQEAMNRVKIQAAELKALNRRLTEVREQLSGDTPVAQGVLAAVEAALVPQVQKIKEEGKAAWNDVLMIEKQIASVREQLTEAGGLVEQEEIPTRKVAIPKSRPRLRKSS
jgi:hypothetical protein